MSEAVEYRIRSVFAWLLHLISFMFFGLGFVIARQATTSGNEDVRALILMSVMAFVGTMCLWQSVAMKKDGFGRAMWERCWGEIPDPPLNAWADQLEERGAFMGGDAE